MTISRLCLLAAGMSLPSLLIPLPANGATPPKPRAATRPPVQASTAIIPLPLNPLVPPAQRLCASRTPSGLGSTMLRPASGAKPAASDMVLVNYIGYLAATGVVFDQGMRTPLRVNGVIPGFAEGLQMVARTGVERLCLPAAIAYGAQATGPIPANADLVFQVELVDFRTAAEAQAADPSPQQDATTQP